jgi:hypothetical protein
MCTRHNSTSPPKKTKQRKFTEGEEMRRELEEEEKESILGKKF